MRCAPNDRCHQEQLPLIPRDSLQDVVGDEFKEDSCSLKNSLKDFFYVFDGWYFL